MKRKTYRIRENRISIIRREKKIKQTDLALALGVSPSYLCKIEKLVQEPSGKFMKACSECLDVPEAELFESGKKAGLNSNLKNKLWEMRIAKGYKQYELARMLHCSPSYLSKVEKGLQRPNDKVRKLCAKILKIKENELFHEAE
ncbi:MAG: transcriptional regulator [Spirochaetia bacterium]|jgi:transcriptional regulator with XRE-family HTH domain|nr:transcriptional regulator [Spirochaetia bacterium]